MVVGMDISLQTELRNVDWELYLLYTEGLHVHKRQLEADLWARVDELEGLIAADG